MRVVVVVEHVEGLPPGVGEGVVGGGGQEGHGHGEWELHSPSQKKLEDGGDEVVGFQDPQGSEEEDEQGLDGEVEVDAVVSALVVLVAALEARVPAGA